MTYYSNEDIKNIIYYSSENKEMTSYSNENIN